MVLPEITIAAQLRQLLILGIGCQADTLTLIRRLALLQTSVPQQALLLKEDVQARVRAAGAFGCVRQRSHQSDPVALKVDPV